MVVYSWDILVCRVFSALYSYALAGILVSSAIIIRLSVNTHE